MNCANSREPEVTAQEIIDSLSKRFGDFFLYMVQCSSTDDARSCLRRLSFVTGGSLAETRTPANVKTIVLEATNGAMAIVAGQLTSDQHCEMFHLIIEVRNPYDIQCHVKEGSPAQREFSKAAARLERERSQAKRKWWQIWR